MMKPFHEWLERKPSGPKKRKQIKRHNRLTRDDTVRLKRTQVRRVSKKQAKNLAEYFRVRKIYLAENYACEAGPIILKAKLPEIYRVPVCKIMATEVHHTAGRGPNLCNVETFCAVCRPCHEFLHGHPQWARSVGLLL